MRSAVIALLAAVAVAVAIAAARRPALLVCVGGVRAAGIQQAGGHRPHRQRLAAGGMAGLVVHGSQATVAGQLPPPDTSPHRRGVVAAVTLA
jgi:hypothetical protein